MAGDGVLPLEAQGKFPGPLWRAGPGGHWLRIGLTFTEGVL